jgi:hypothetical protein
MIDQRNVFMKPQHLSIPDIREYQLAGLFDNATRDPYESGACLFEPSVCTDCSAVYDDGRWQWLIPPADAHRIRCRACRRIRDKVPAGYVSINGRFAKEYREELQLLIQIAERRAKSEYPMQRIISIEEQGTGLVIGTSDLHLAGKIGEALHQAYQGKLDFEYSEAEYVLWVRWQRWN